MISLQSLASSSSGNCAVYCGGGQVVLIEAGTNTKYIRGALAQLGLTLQDVTQILITHTHNDHISALPVLTKHCRATVWCSEQAWGLLLPHCNHSQVETFAPERTFWLGSVAVTPFATPHDSPGSCGFVLEEEEGKLAYCTDLGCMTPQIFDHLEGAEGLFLESNHDVYMLKNGEYPYHLKQRILSDQGHLSNDDAAQTVCALAGRGLRQVVLAHLSDHNNTPRCALRETQDALQRMGALGAVEASVAPRREPGAGLRLARHAG